MTYFDGVEEAQQIAQDATIKSVWQTAYQTSNTKEACLYRKREKEKETCTLPSAAGRMLAAYQH